MNKHAIHLRKKMAFAVSDDRLSSPLFITEKR